MKTTILFLLICLFLCTNIGKAQDKSINRVAVLPFQSDNIDRSLVGTLESVFRFEIENQKSINVISADTVKQKLHGDECFDFDCAIRIGTELNCDQVVCTKLIGLGEKIIIQYFLIDVKNSKELLKEQITSAKVDDMETVIKRIVKSIVSEKPTTEDVEVGTIMKSETVEQNRRASNRNYGFSFGYLFPLSGYDDENDKVFTFDFRYGYELDDIEVGMLVGIRNGAALNVYSSFLTARTDISPFIGGSFGFHWVAHDDWSDQDSDGFELGLRGGVRFFRTYGFQILLNLEFIHTFNDYDDNAIVFTIGFL